MKGGREGEKGESRSRAKFEGCVRRTSGLVKIGVRPTTDASAGPAAVIERTSTVDSEDGDGREAKDAGDLGWWWLSREERG